MTLSMATESDEKLLAFAKEAKAMGAYVQVTTSDEGSGDRSRRITISYNTHSPQSIQF